MKLMLNVSKMRTSSSWTSFLLSNMCWLLLIRCLLTWIQRNATIIPPGSNENLGSAKCSIMFPVFGDSKKVEKHNLITSNSVVFLSNCGPYQ